MEHLKPTWRCAGGSAPTRPGRTSGRWLPALLGLAAAALMAGGIGAAEAHYSGTFYHNVDVTVLEYERVPYDAFDLVLMGLVIENYESVDLRDPRLFLGGTREYAEGASADPNVKSYSHVGSAEVKRQGGDALPQDCSSVDMWDTIPANGLGQTSACFMVGKAFEPDGLMVAAFDKRYHSETYSNDRCGPRTLSHDPHTCRALRQVVPFNDGSVFCFEHNLEYCNADNVQFIGGTAVPAPAPEPPQQEESAPAALVYGIYNNGTGTLTLVFDRPVVAHDPDRISLIHDIAAYIEDGTAPGLGAAELSTVDNKRQSTILAFALAGEIRAQVSESLEAHGDLALLVRSGAVYSADGFADVTAHLEDGSILVGDLTVVR